MDNSPKMEAAVDAVFELLSHWSDEKFFRELQGSYDGEFAHLLKDAGVFDLDSAIDLASVEHAEHIEIVSSNVSNCYVSINYKHEDSKILYKRITEPQFYGIKKDDEVSFNSIIGEGPNSWMTKIA